MTENQITTEQKAWALKHVPEELKTPELCAAVLDALFLERPKNNR